jgi:predicted O-linked N-acetylglucosamine transferase (SPINDLY family)
MEYENLAIELASNSQKLDDVRKKLAQNRLDKPLFDSLLYTKNLENVYEKMMARYLAGLSAEHLS